jgi:uncharacterized BrkB/YihY/UPF0761 family membrane protein
MPSSSLFGARISWGQTIVSFSDDEPDVDRTPPEEIASTEAAGPSTEPARPVQLEERGSRLRNRISDARSTVDETKRSLLERTERERDRHESVRALFHLVEADRGRGGGLLSGGLAYRMFIWLLPAALAATSLLRLVADKWGKPPSEAARSMGMAASLAETVGRAAAQAGRATPILLVMGLGLMLWASRGVLKALRLVSAIAWGMRPAPLQAPIRATLASAGILTVLSLYGFFLTPLYRGSLGGDLIATILATAGIAAIATWAARALPHPDGARASDFIPGGILFGVGFEALRLASTLYFARKLERVDDLYGALGVAAVFMTYLYLVGRLAVLALMTNAAVRHSGLFRENIDQIA